MRRYNADRNSDNNAMNYYENRHERSAAICRQIAISSIDYSHFEYTQTKNWYRSALKVLRRNRKTAPLPG